MGVEFVSITRRVHCLSVFLQKWSTALPSYEVKTAVEGEK
jgi:hypothetical protein